MRRHSTCNRLPAARRPALPYGLGKVPAYIDSALVPPRASLSPAAAVRRMADDMRSASYREGGVTEADLETLGWTRGQVKTYGADARAMAQQLAGASL